MRAETVKTILTSPVTFAANALRTMVSDVLFRAGDREASTYLDRHPLETQAMFEAAVLALREKKGIKAPEPVNIEQMADNILQANRAAPSYGRMDTTRPSHLAQMASNLHVFLDRVETHVDFQHRSGLPHHILKSFVKALQKIGNVRAKGVSTPNMDAIYRTTTDFRSALVVTLEAAQTVLRFGLKAADVNNADEFWAARAEVARRAEATAAQMEARNKLRAIAPVRIDPMNLPHATVPVSDVKTAEALARRLWATEADQPYNVHSIVALPVMVGATPETWVFGFSHNKHGGSELPPVRLAGSVPPAGYTGDKARAHFADVLAGATDVEPTAVDAAKAELARLADAWPHAAANVEVWDTAPPTGAKGRASLPARVMEGASADTARYGLNGVGLSRARKDGAHWFVTSNGRLLLAARANRVEGAPRALGEGAMLPGNVARACGPTLAVTGGNSSMIIGTETTLFVGATHGAPDHWVVVPDAERNNHTLVRFDDVKKLTKMPAYRGKEGSRLPVVLNIPDPDVSSAVPVLDLRGYDGLPNVSGSGVQVHDVVAGKGKRATSYEPPKRVGFNPDYIEIVAKFLLNLGAASCTWQITHALGPVVVRGYYEGRETGAHVEVPAFAILMPMRLDRA